MRIDHERYSTIDRWRRIVHRRVDNVRPTLIRAVVLAQNVTETLKQARDDLKQAEKTADDEGTREEIRETAEAYRDYVVGDHEPDHAILDEHLNTLRQIRRQVDGDTEEQIERALEATENYRTDVEQA
ncbi:hypothetical protein AArc1_3210 [Natrarchaeobaculum sulfurireducens]|uniref:Uncharacterized protein n=1 Tax=Natrarchaeobaculum sulfurireducens TaxID=2044521 RepID=A0A346PJ20_9EURY|nr:hypothetical protein AArc1_3210 [Natrarchaeobaculum sulfurireducens]